MRSFIPCQVKGTSDIGTTQDYGQGVFRINRALGKILGGPDGLPRRGGLWRIETKDHQRLFAILRHYDGGGDDPMLWTEYESRRTLKMSGKSEAKLYFRRAYRFEYLLFLWEHIDPLIQVQFRVAVFLTIASVFLGFMLGYAVV
jgi:hypothetical protein